MSNGRFQNKRNVGFRLVLVLERRHIFADAVKDDYRVVYGISNDGNQSGYQACVYRNAEDDNQRKRYDNVDKLRAQRSDTAE